MAGNLTSAFVTRRRLRSRWLWSAALTALLVAIAAVVAIAGDHSGVPLVMTLTVLAMLLFPYLSFATTSFARDLAWWLRRSSGAALLQIFSFFIAGYLVYAVGTGSFTWESLGRVAAFVGIPMLLVWPVQKRLDVTWCDWLAIAAIWVPFDFGLLKTIWTWPEGGAAYMLNTVMAINLAVILFVCWRGFGGINLRFSMERKDVKLVVLGFVAFLAFALPFGMATDFIGFNLQVNPGKAFLTPIGFFFFVGIPEELLFRGLLQNLLQKKLGRPVLSLILASVIFGATHLNNGPAPDWRYFVLATAAGLVYGTLYSRS